MQKILWIDAKKENWDTIQASKPANSEIHFLGCSRQVMDTYMKEHYDLVVIRQNFSHKSGEGVIFDIKLQNPKQEIIFLAEEECNLNVPRTFGVRVFLHLNALEKIFFCGMNCKYRSVCRYASTCSNDLAASKVCRFLHS